MSAPLPPEVRSERAARLLGYSGLAPFAAAVLVAWATPLLFPAGFGDAALRWGLAYAAVILSFMGGARWSLAMVNPDARPNRAFAGLLAAVLPALLGWAMLIPASLLPLPLWLRFILLGVGFALLLKDDLDGIRAGEGPFWYGSLRKRLTAGVLAAIALILLRLAIG